jgi:hypothetical protein
MIRAMFYHIPFEVNCFVLEHLPKMVIKLKKPNSKKTPAPKSLSSRKTKKSGKSTAGASVPQPHAPNNTEIFTAIQNTENTESIPMTKMKDVDNSAKSKMDTHQKKFFAAYGGNDSVPSDADTVNIEGSKPKYQAPSTLSNTFSATTAQSETINTFKASTTRLL